MRRHLAAFGVALSLLAACGGGDRDLVGVTRDPAPQVDAVALPDLSDGGAPFDFHAPADGLLIVYFGYTNCPDVCPTTMADLKVALDDLGADADRVEVAMVTVDPARDTPVLTDYVQSFVPGAHAIATDDQAALQTVAGPFGVSYEVRTAPNGEIEVGHSSNLFAVDDAGRLVLTWSVGGGEGTARADDLAGDIRQLLDA
jgi:protein SCO1